MTFVVVTAGKGAPGATTAAIALTLAWQREVLLVDADPDGGDVVPGLLPGRASTDRGLLSWAVATRRVPALDGAAAVVEHVVALPEAQNAWVLPGLQGPTQSPQLTGAGGWERLARALERLGASHGRDVIVDTGRLGERSCWPVLSACDVVLLVVRPTARAVQGARSAAAMMRQRFGDLDSVRLLVVGQGPYTAAEVATALDIELLGKLPLDGRAAAAFSEGAPSTMRGLRRSRLVRSAAGVADALAARSAAGVPA